MGEILQSVVSVSFHCMFQTNWWHILVCARVMIVACRRLKVRVIRSKVIANFRWSEFTRSRAVTRSVWPRSMAKCLVSFHKRERYASEDFDAGVPLSAQTHLSPAPFEFRLPKRQDSENAQILRIGAANSPRTRSIKCCRRAPQQIGAKLFPAGVSWRRNR